MEKNISNCHKKNHNYEILLNKCLRLINYIFNNERISRETSIKW